MIGRKKKRTEVDHPEISAADYPRPSPERSSPDSHQDGTASEKVIDSKSNFIVAWTEFWGQLEKPNTLVEVPEELLSLQMEALAKHVGEVERNPYHLRLPAWMMDSVRRGSEVISGKGAEAPLIPTEFSTRSRQ